MIRAIIFDFDGVLVESVNVKTEAFVEIFKEYPQWINKIREYHLRNGGISRVIKFRYIYENYLKRALSEEQLQVLCDQFRRLVMDNVIASDYVEGAKRFLDEYSSQYALFVASGTPHEELEEIIARRQMRDYFQGIFGSPEKKAQIVGRIMEKYGYQKNEVVFVGDSVNDLDAAKDQNIPFIAMVDREGNGWANDSAVDLVVGNMKDFHSQLLNLKVQSV